MRKTTLWMVTILLAAAAAWAERPVNESRPAAANASISIENVAGSLEIIGSDGAELQVTGTLGDDVEELEIEGDAEEWSIEVVIPDDEMGGKRDISAHLTVRVPRGATLEVAAVSAAIEIRGVEGAIEAGSVSGAVSVSGGSSDVEVESVSGAVSVTGGSGSIEVESVSGEVELKGVSGDLEATTVSGQIRVEAEAVADVEIGSVAGGVFFQGRPGGGSLEIESHSGNVEVLLPAGVSARFELESFSGRIDNGLGPPATRVDSYAPGVSVEFATGSGETRVSIETFSGNISLRSF
jgi:DUF4097 and DUF4098 domain-containing protein YvlB